MGRYCCFCCPASDYSGKSLDDSCPTCSRRYGFPLYDSPDTIDSYKVVKFLGRGFYAATYVAERGALKTPAVLKVSPQSFFEYFPNKDFESECQKHAEVARGTEHIVGIRDMFSATVSYTDIDLRCNVAELDYVQGRLLADYLMAEENLSASIIAQLAIDLFRIRDELRNKGVHHNDLHAENIIVAELGRDARRAYAIHDSVRAVAIDLGSIAEESRSDSGKGRLGDLHRIGEHLQTLVFNLLRDPDAISDLDNRLANALQLIVHSISPNAENQRTPDSADYVSQIQDAYHRVSEHWRPWRQTLSLQTFGASYNAQTLQAWHVPDLLVDPDGDWLSALCEPGPQVITGMRGCGKTMLLRALQFHARAAQRAQETNADILARLRNDRYVGLFVSAQRLLDQLGARGATVGDPFARLFVAYGLEAVRAVHHLRDIDDTVVSSSAYDLILRAIGDCLNLGDQFSPDSNAYELEYALSSLLISLSRGDIEQREYTLTVHPNMAFQTLDAALRNCSSIWQPAQVFFLLDDVSTRYLDQSAIGELLSALLFQSATCAFKLTSEVQTMELGLKSPGKNHLARIGRDLRVFDLGAKVYEKIKKQGDGNGKDFVERILHQRAEHFAGHPDATPGTLLGDVPLETIATEIGGSRNNSRTRKGVYRGITALARMCVGDIGDLISLYEQILRTAVQQPVPIPQAVQSECFQDFCARRLYDLSRRGGFLKDIAKSFAEASHELLVKSWRKRRSGNGEKKRIRQYSSLYVRVTTGDIERQTEQLRELIDAGVFVFAGGSNVPRTKTRDSNPTQQFKLTYRKIYGLVNFIGLAERDRFELSGPDLAEWLAHPSRGKEILLRNLGGDCEDEEDHGRDGDPASPAGDTLSDAGGEGDQIGLFKLGELVPTVGASAVSPSYTLDDSPVVVKRALAVDGSTADLRLGARIDHLVVGLGFEARTLASVQRVCGLVRPKDAVVVKYRERGRADQILEIVSDTVDSTTIVPYQDVIQDGFPELGGNVLIDITGLAKPVIFHSIRNELRRNGRVWIFHTEAAQYYPLDADLQPILVAERERDRHALLEEIQGVLTGEKGPYELDSLLRSDSDETRHRVLCAASSPKHERLLSLLDFREYDRVEIVAPRSESARGRVAQVAADVAARNLANSSVTYIDSNDLSSMLDFVVQRYRTWYIGNGLNFELGLTGSKLQAVACSAASAACKISRCWYIRPRSFDPERFTTGVGESRVYEIALNPQ